MNYQTISISIKKRKKLEIINKEKIIYIPETEVVIDYLLKDLNKNLKIKNFGYILFFLISVVFIGIIFFLIFSKEYWFLIFPVLTFFLTIFFFLVFLNSQNKENKKIFIKYEKKLKKFYCFEDFNKNNNKNSNLEIRNIKTFGIKYWKGFKLIPKLKIIGLVKNGSKKVLTVKNFEIVKIKDNLKKIINKINFPDNKLKEKIKKIEIKELKVISLKENFERIEKKDFENIEDSKKVYFISNNKEKIFKIIKNEEKDSHIFNESFERFKNVKSEKNIISLNNIFPPISMNKIPFPLLNEKKKSKK